MDKHTYVLHSLYLTTKNMCMRYRWVSWGVVSLPEGKSRGLCLVQLCAKYRLVSAKSSLLPLVLKDKRSCFSQGKRSALQLPLDCAFALQKYIVECLIDIWNPSIMCPFRQGTPPLSTQVRAPPPPHPPPLSTQVRAPPPPLCLLKSGHPHPPLCLLKSGHPHPPPPPPPLCLLKSGRPHPPLCLLKSGRPHHPPSVYSSQGTPTPPLSTQVRAPPPPPPPLCLLKSGHPHPPPSVYSSGQ